MTGNRKRKISREVYLDSALRKRERGVPTYTVSEAAALLDISTMTLYRMINSDGFPAIRFGVTRTGGAGRFVVPAKAIEDLLTLAVERGGIVDPTDVMDGSNRTL
jgi:excisionase family DNA binding protein